MPAAAQAVKSKASQENRNGDNISTSQKNKPQSLQSLQSAAAAQLQPKTEAAANLTGIPTGLKEHLEEKSGFSFDDVRVHYNSDKPAQLQALAYTQGTEVHIAPGQEKHLPHELGHVIQQKQGRVEPTVQMQGVNVNDDEALEREADKLGEKPVQLKADVIQMEAYDVLCNIRGTYREAGGKRKHKFDERDLFLVHHNAHPPHQVNYRRIALQKLREQGTIPAGAHDIQYAAFNTRSAY